MIIENILDAMCFSSNKARDKFPRLLEILNEYPNQYEIFIHKVNYFYHFNSSKILNLGKKSSLLDVYSLDISNNGYFRFSYLIIL